MLGRNAPLRYGTAALPKYDRLNIQSPIHLVIQRKLETFSIHTSSLCYWAAAIRVPELTTA